MGPMLPTTLEKLAEKELISVHGIYSMADPVADKSVVS